MLKYLTVSFVFVLCTVSISWALGEKPAQQERQAIDFSLPDLSGKTVKLSDFKGKTVFLNFFATWCPPCRQEMPSMQKLYDKLKGLPAGRQDKKFEMVAVSIDQAGVSAVKPFIEKGGYTFKVLLDPRGVAAEKYQIMSIPTTFIIGADGKILKKEIGSRNWAEEATIKWLKNL